MKSRDFIKKLCLLALLLTALSPAMSSECLAAGADPVPSAPAAAAMDNETAAALAPLTIERYVYESNGRKDPFLSMVEIKKKKLAASTASKPNRPPRALSPLEFPELKNISLKGIVIDAKKKYAVVELDGKTFVITERMYIGREGGRVVKINSDSLSVELPIVDELGKESKILQPIPLRKEGQE
ncbi:MAG: pilus assembly protein PilP [Nitrospirae bacterium]|nr:pilus assembly protein PilP [Nitrospirota bacterium]